MPAHKDINELKKLFAIHQCTLLESEYRNLNIPMQFICKCGEKCAKPLATIARTGNIKCNKCAGVHRPTQEEAENLFKDSGCKLLDTYVNARKLMNYTCHCGSKNLISLHDFKKGCRCKKCGIEKRSEKTRRSYESVKQYFDKAGCTLISASYENAHAKLDYICICGEQSQITFNSFRMGGRCGCGHANAVSGECHYRWNQDRGYIKLRKIVSDRCRGVLKRCLKYSDDTNDIIGYSSDDLLKHLTNYESWNDIIKNKWNIDHIFPIKAFVEHGITDLRVINSLDNLQPLSQKDNFKKKAKYDIQEFYKYLARKGIDYDHGRYNKNNHPKPPSK